MKIPFYDEVHQCAVDMVNASEIDDREAHWQAYNQLKDICEAHERGEFNHPFQWESLGDFTYDNETAIWIYLKALKSANGSDHQEFIASIKLALAKRYRETNKIDKAISEVQQAKKSAEDIDDPDLKKEIRWEFLSIGEVLLRALVELNSDKCSEQDLELIKELIDVDELGIALDQFCAMWHETNKPALNKKSEEIIHQCAELWSKNHSTYTKGLSFKS